MYKRGMALLSVLALAASVLALAAGSPGERAESFTLPAPDGSTVAVDTLATKNGAVLFFFASWCKQSNGQVDGIQALTEAGTSRNVAVYGVSLQETAKTIRGFSKKKKVTFPVLLDEKMEVAEKYGVQGIPTIIGIDAKGNIAWRVHGLPEDSRELLDALSPGE
jgi:peroxiredoxin